MKFIRLLLFLQQFPYLFFLVSVYHVSMEVPVILTYMIHEHKIILLFLLHACDGAHEVAWNASLAKIRWSKFLCMRRWGVSFADASPENCILFARGSLVMGGSHERDTDWRSQNKYILNGTCFSTIQQSLISLPLVRVAKSRSRLFIHPIFMI